MIKKLRALIRLKIYLFYLRQQETYLERKALPWCHRCYGRGYSGFNTNIGAYNPCTCVTHNRLKVYKRVIKKYKQLGDKEQANVYKRRIKRQRKVKRGN